MKFEILIQHIMCVLAITTTILLHIEKIIPQWWLMVVAICLLVIINGVRTIFILGARNIERGL